MGQRSQIFITFNKVKYSYYNQWCYGKGFLTTIYNLLEMISNRDFKFRADRIAGYISTKYLTEDDKRGGANFKLPYEMSIFSIINFIPNKYSGFMGWSFTDDDPTYQDNNTIRILGADLEDSGALTPEQYLKEYYGEVWDKEELDIVTITTNSILQNNFKLLLK